jgi:hypothetical protein
VVSEFSFCSAFMCNSEQSCRPIRNSFRETVSSEHSGRQKRFLCNGWEHYVPYRCLWFSNKLCDSTLCTCGGVEEQMHNVDYVPGP